MKNIFFVLLAFFLLPASVTQVMAYTEWSAYEPPTSYGTTYTEWSNPGNVYDVNETNYAESNTTYSGATKRETYGDYQFDEITAPSGIMTRLTVQRTNSGGVVDIATDWNWTDQAYNVDRLANECWGVATMDQDVRLANDTSEQTIEMYIVDGEGTSCVYDYFIENGWDNDDFVTIIQVSIGTTAQQVRILDVDTRIIYEPVTSSEMTSYVASESAQVVYADVQGVTAYAGENVLCEVDYFEDCVGDGYAAFKSETPVATILLDPEYEGTTSAKLAGNVYQGIGYSETSSQWYAYNVEFPYHPGYTCHYPTWTTCTEATYSCNEEDPPICTWSSNEVVVSEYSENESFEIIHTGGYEDPEPSNPIQWIFWKLKNWFWDVFGFGQVTYSDFRNPGLEAEMAQRAPFAYIDAFNDLDFTPTATSSSVPSWTFNFPDQDPVTYTAPSAIVTFFSVIRTNTRFIIWLLFIMYLFNLSKRMF